MAMRGADVEMLLDLANRLEVTWATSIDTLISQIDTNVQASANNVWIGPDADQFRNVEWPRHKSALQSARMALQEAGGTAKKNAQRQQETSDIML